MKRSLLSFLLVYLFFTYYDACTCFCLLLFIDYSLVCLFVCFLAYLPHQATEPLEGLGFPSFKNTQRQASSSKHLSIFPLGRRKKTPCDEATLRIVSSFLITFGKFTRAPFFLFNYFWEPPGFDLKHFFEPQKSQKTGATWTWR